MVFYSTVIAALAGLAASGYRAWREDELRVGAMGDDLARNLGATGVVAGGPSIVPFWLLIGVGVMAACVAVGVGVALWVVPDAHDPPAGRTDHD